MDDSVFRLMIFCGILLLMALAQWMAPRRVLSMWRKRWLGNFALLALDVVLVRIVLPAGAMGAAWWAQSNDFGLLHWLEWSDAFAVIIAVVLLDLLIYGQHVLTHTVPVLWRLHMVHHADREIDVSTGLRFHPIEIVLSLLIKMAVVVLLGAPLLAVVIFEIVLNGMAMFNHANVRLPAKLDAALRWLIITPDVHRIHHSIIKHETNSNYGFNLALWDRLFGTYRAQPQAGHDDMTIGLEHLQDAPTHRLDFMLRLPFDGELGQYPILRSDQAGNDEGSNNV